MSLSEPNPISRFVEKLEGRSLLGSVERSALLSLNGTMRQLHANRDIVSEGERVDYASFIVSGLVGSFGQTHGGQRQITALHLAGDMANLQSVMVPEASEALQTLSMTTILQVPHVELRDLAECYPALAFAFWRESVVCNAIAAQWIVNLGRRSALSRMAHLLCEIGCRETGSDGCDGLSYGFLGTQTHLADMLGLTPVHVNRTIGALRSKRLIQYGGRTITIPDWKALAGAGEFDVGYLQLRPREASSAMKGRMEAWLTHEAPQRAPQLAGARG